MKSFRMPAAAMRAAACISSHCASQLRQEGQVAGQGSRFRGSSGDIRCGCSGGGSANNGGKRRRRWGVDAGEGGGSGGSGGCRSSSMLTASPWCLDLTAVSLPRQTRCSRRCGSACTHQSPCHTASTSTRRTRRSSSVQAGRGGRQGVGGGTMQGAGTPPAATRNAAAAMHHLTGAVQRGGWQRCMNRHAPCHVRRPQLLGSCVLSCSLRAASPAHLVAALGLFCGHAAARALFGSFLQAGNQAGREGGGMRGQGCSGKSGEVGGGRQRWVNPACSTGALPLQVARRRGGTPPRPPTCLYLRDAQQLLLLPAQVLQRRAPAALHLPPQHRQLCFCADAGGACTHTQKHSICQSSRFP